ncbi:MAG TPA: hypothetical protein VMJ65_22225 [Solirubrobacteraceae bacterium]|nr:hypothetical protein [Solirubrobacteraceae bacterium]
MVTLLTVPLPESLLELEEPVDCELEFELESELEPDDELLLGELDATVVADECLARAGSFPDTSTIVINSQDATKIASAPAMMRRRIIRTRARRAARIACPRA